MANEQTSPGERRAVEAVRERIEELEADAYEANERLTYEQDLGAAKQERDTLVNDPYGYDDDGGHDPVARHAAKEVGAVLDSMTFDTDDEPDTPELFDDVPIRDRADANSRFDARQAEEQRAVQAVANAMGVNARGESLETDEPDGGWPEEEDPGN